MQYVDGDKEGWISAEAVAAVMGSLCENKSYPGGTILEVGWNGTVRKVNPLNDPGPSGLGTRASNADLGIDEVRSFIKKDLRETKI